MEEGSGTLVSWIPPGFRVFPILLTSAVLASSIRERVEGDAAELLSRQRVEMDARARHLWVA